MRPFSTSASQFARVFWEDPQPFEDDGVPMAIDQLPPDFYATKDFTDKMIEFLKSNDGETPWFAYVPYSAPHWPLQLPEDWLDRHAGRYDSGFDVLREERMARAQEIYAVMDVLPTFLEIAGTEHPGASTYKGREINGIIGRSFWPHLTGESATVHLPTDVAGWEREGFGALIRGD